MSLKVDLVPVRLGDGRVVMHTWEQWLRLIKDVDRKAAEAMRTPIQPKGRP